MSSLVFRLENFGESSRRLPLPSNMLSSICDHDYGVDESSNGGDDSYQFVEVSFVFKVCLLLFEFQIRRIPDFDDKNCLIPNLMFLSFVLSCILNLITVKIFLNLIKT